jgi:anti-sigma factor RsiW
MRDDMTCARAFELLSDHLEDTLRDPLRSELEGHLRSCAACAALREELAFVAEALREFPEVEPSASLATRVAEAALRANREAGREEKLVPFPVASRSTPPLATVTTEGGVAPMAWRPRSRPRVALLPAWAQSLAAGLSLVTLGTLLLTTRSEAPARAAAQIVGATVSTGVYLAERKERLVEDVRVLRVVLETAFEGRLERVGDRVEDYRRLLERRRGQESENDPEDRPSPSRTNDTRYTFPNPLGTGPVTLS